MLNRSVNKGARFCEEFLLFSRPVSWNEGVPMRFPLFCVAVLLSIGSAFAAEFKVLPEKSEVRFSVLGRPNLLAIEGKGARPYGALRWVGEKITGEIWVDLNEFATGLSLRDRHLRSKYFETSLPGNEKGVLGKLELEKNCIEALRNHAEAGCRFRGVLRLHGKSGEVEGVLQIKPEAEGFVLKAQTKLRPSAFAIPRAKFAGISVDDEANVNAEISLSGQAQ
jgi:YceI-like domain